MKSTDLAIVILAAGKGTRMKSDMPKVMHKIAGRTLLGHVLDQVAGLSAKDIVVVIGPDMETVATEVGPHQIAIQHDRLGTGHAVGMAKEQLHDHRGHVLVLYGDAPLIRTETLLRVLDRAHKKDNPAITVLGMRPSDPGPYGRLVLGKEDNLIAIVEAKDASPKELEIGLCNSGIMLVDATNLWGWIERLNNKNAKGEYYLTDIVALANKDGHKTCVVEAPAEELLGINSRRELAIAEAHYQNRCRDRAMESGATLIDPMSVQFSFDTKIGQDVVIEPHVFFGPNVSIGDGAHIRAFSHIEGARIDKNAIIGPFARLRAGSIIGEGAHIGNFVETKKAELGAGAKANHLSYLGDAKIGAKANIGAGTITCNYDGFEKMETIIGAGAFVGSDTALVAPVTVGEGAIIGAGSIITKDVAPGALAIARAPQIEKPGWAERFRKLKKEKR